MYIEQRTPPTTRDGQSIIIRPMRLDDAESFTEMMASPEVCWGTLQMPHTPLERRREWLTSSLTTRTNTLICAEVDGVVVGNLGLHGYHGRRQHVASLGMSVHVDWHGQQIGSALVAEALWMADQWLGIRRIELTVFPDNPPAVRLYEKFGFVTEGIAIDFAFRDGRFVDALQMARINPRV